MMRSFGFKKAGISGYIAAVGPRVRRKRPTIPGHAGQESALTRGVNRGVPGSICRFKSAGFLRVERGTNADERNSWGVRRAKRVVRPPS